MSKAMKSTIALKYNDTDVPKSVTDECESFIFEDNADGAADSIEVKLNNSTGKWLRNWHPENQDSLKAWIRVEDWQQDKKNAKLYCGKFTIDELAYVGFPETVQIRAISIPISGGFNVTERSKTWEKTNTKQIFSDIAKRAQVSLVYDADVYDVAEESQSGKTDMEFAYGLCSDYGLALKLYNDKMVIYDRGRYEKKKAVFTISREMLKGSYSIKEQIRTVYDSGKMQYTDGKSTLTYEYIIPGKKGVRRMFVSSKAESIKDAELKVKTKLRENLRESKTIELTLMGNIGYRAAENFTLKDFGKLDGTYFIDYVRHEKSGGRYICQISAHRVVTDF